jgi:hypothetical protein
MGKIRLHKTSKGSESGRIHNTNYRIPREKNHKIVVPGNLCMNNISEIILNTAAKSRRLALNSTKKCRFTFQDYSYSFKSFYSESGSCCPCVSVHPSAIQLNRYHGEQLYGSGMLPRRETKRISRGEEAHLRYHRTGGFVWTSVESCQPTGHRRSLHGAMGSLHGCEG